MSRRSRKSGRSAGLGWLGRAAIGLVLAGVVLAGILFASIRAYLHSDSFRSLLSAKVGEVASVEGFFTPFRWQGLAVDTDTFDATGSGLVRKLKVEGLHTEVGVGGIGRGVWQLEGSNIRRLDVSLEPVKSPDREIPNTPDRVSASASGRKSWLPTEVELKSADVQELVVRARLAEGPLKLGGMRVHLDPSGPRRSYRVETLGGVLELPFPWLPEIRMDRAKARWQDGRMFVHSATGSLWSDGRLDVSGEWDTAAKTYAFEGGVSDVKCGDIFNEDWAKRFTGGVASDFTIDNRGGQPVARGKLRIRNGTITALPMLDALAAYADTRRFRVLTLTEASTEWRWKNGELFFSNLVLASEGLIRLEGGVIIRGREIDGNFRLGLVPGTLAGIPGAETHVFAPGERGLLWTPLRITGTLDDPKEDLTDRLVAAAGVRMFDVIPETGEKVIKFSRTVLGDAPSKAVDQGVKIIEEGADIVRDVGGVLDGILGTAPKTPVPPEPTEEKR